MAEYFDCHVLLCTSGFCSFFFFHVPGDARGAHLTATQEVFIAVVLAAQQKHKSKSTSKTSEFFQHPQPFGMLIRW